MPIIVRESSIHGVGAFTTDFIQRGTVLGQYKGRKMTQQQVDAKWGTSLAPYVLRLKDGSFVDGSSGGNWTSKINDGPHSNRAQNVEFDDINIVAITDIPAHFELLISYGRSYWLYAAPTTASVATTPTRPRIKL